MLSVLYASVDVKPLSQVGTRPGVTSENSSGSSVLRHERLTAILHIVASRGSVSIDDVIGSFGVSAATARRDVDELAEQQLVTRTRGGATAFSLTYDLPLRYKNSNLPDAKRRIAEAAAALVAPGDVIGLNGGTTTTELARSLSQRAGAPDTAYSLSSVTLVTNALNIANELAVRPQFKIVVIGGTLRPQSYELIGPFSEAVVNGITLNVMFLGVDALSLKEGAAANDEGEALINRVMTERAQRVVAVADSSKLTRRAFSTICSITEIDDLITDTSTPPEVVGELRAAGVQVHTV